MPAPGAGPGSPSGTGGPGSLGGSGQKRDKAREKADKAKSKPSATKTPTLLDDDPNVTGTPSTVPGATPPGQLPAGLNPAKYSVNNNVSYEASLSNIAKAVGTAAMVGPSTAPGVIGGAVTGITDDLGLGYDNPTGIVGGADYDASQVKENNISPTSAKELHPSVEQLSKKKKPLAPGFTLLAGQPGTLLGS